MDDLKELVANPGDLTLDSSFVVFDIETTGFSAVKNRIIEIGAVKIENGVVEGYKKIENGVVGGYKKIETGAVDGFNKVTDKCVEVLFAREGESVEDAKQRLSGKEKK